MFLERYSTPETQWDMVKRTVLPSVLGREGILPQLMVRVRPEVLLIACSLDYR